MAHDKIKMNTRLGYITDSTTSLYKQLEDLLKNKRSIRQKYVILREMFKRVINQEVALNNINFIGLFAKLDYVVKKYDIPEHIALQIQDTRHTLNTMHDATDAELEASLTYDVKATTLLVRHVGDGTDIPESLYRLLPTNNRKRRWGKFDVNLLRCIVVAWDDDYIYATEEQNDSQLKIAYGNINKYLTLDGKTSWTYLRKILCKNAQINLIRIRMENDVCMPELIIYEPDYLIDITTIAACFESYAESPYVALINKLKPQPNTIHIHLGNLAGRFLDDTVHQRHISFNDSIKDFFKDNALSLTACDDMADRPTVQKFYAEAKAQKINIEKLIGEDLPQEIDDYDPKDVILEPTFFSNMLGIQGRLDMLHKHNGRTTIVEQKSGKGGYIPPCAPNFNPNRPEAQEKHLVQLSLYRALFNYEFQFGAKQRGHFMLLYSKYRDGLISIGNIPELTHRAIRMRNLLAWCEMSYASKGMRILERITPDMLNQKHISGKLWDNWTRPELQRLLCPISDATPIERAYYFRFMQFIEKEHLLSKVGNKTKDDSGFASIWLDSLEDKRTVGNIYENMSIYEFGTKNGMVESIRLKFDKEQDTDTSNFRRGDIVILYPYAKGSIPNACRQMVNRGSISDITSSGVEITLRNSQTDKLIFDTSENTKWAIEHDMFESSSKALYSGMHSFLSANKERRDLILCQRQPRVDVSLRIKGCYGAFDHLVEAAKQARDLFLVIGPPGTGKTSFGLLNILKEELLDEDSNILLLSYTNRAVDEICSKLTENNIDFIRIGSRLTCDAAYHKYLLAKRAESCSTTKEMRDLIVRTKVVCATTSALNANAHIFNIKHFNLAIVDEASQILEPHLIGLLSAKAGNDNAIERFVLIGDHKQLPAVVQQTEQESAVDDQLLRAINLVDCRRSLFERLLAEFKTKEGYDTRFVYMLKRQGRMHQDIAEFPNVAFYDGKLGIVPLKHQTLPCLKAASKNGIAQILSSRRIAFMAAPKPKAFETAKTNSVEADMIAATVREIYRLTRDKFEETQTIGIIVPYRNQIATIRGAIDRFGIDALHNITIDTVERYQGSQRDYIIYGFTVQEPYQLNFLTNNVFEEGDKIIDRKLNVAMTRSRLHMVLIGNPEILSRDIVFSKLIRYVKKKNCYFDISPDKYCSGCFSVD